MKSDTQYRVKFSYALKITLLIVVMAAMSLLAGLNMIAVEIHPSLLIILIALYLAYVSRLLKDDSGSKILQLGLSTVGVIAAVLAILFLGGLAIAIIGVGLFGILGAYYVWVNLITRQPVIQANSEKLMLHNGFFKSRNFEVSWDEIADLSVITQNLYAGNKMKFLVVKLADPEQFKLKSGSKTLAKVMAMNEKMYGGQLVVAASNLDTNDQEILARLNEHIRK